MPQQTADNDFRNAAEDQARLTPGGEKPGTKKDRQYEHFDKREDDMNYIDFLEGKRENVKSVGFEVETDAMTPARREHAPPDRRRRAEVLGHQP